MKFRNVTIKEEHVKQISEAISKMFNTPERKNKLLQFELKIAKYLDEKHGKEVFW